MRNLNYDPEVLAETVYVVLDDLRTAEKPLEELAESLTKQGDAYDGHAHDHAAEHLQWAAKRFSEIADRLTRLTAYTNYPPAGDS